MKRLFGFILFIIFCLGLKQSLNNHFILDEIFTLINEIVRSDNLEDFIIGYSTLIVLIFNLVILPISIGMIFMPNEIHIGCCGGI